MVSLSRILRADGAERGEAGLEGGRQMSPHALLRGIGIVRFDGCVDVEMLADGLARTLDAVLSHLLEGEAALRTQIVVGLRQPAIAGGAKQLVVEGPADLLGLFDIEARARLD